MLVDGVLLGVRVLLLQSGAAARLVLGERAAHGCAPEPDPRVRETFVETGVLRTEGNACP